MSSYDLMIQANYSLITGAQLNDMMQRRIVKQLLASQSRALQLKRLYNSAHSQDAGSENPRMYSVFFTPPYRGSKLKTLFGKKPQSYILASNMVELEILRLLNVFAPDRHEVMAMTESTLERLQTTCFAGQGCATGECFDAMLISLRFLATAAPQETAWIRRLLHVYTEHAEDKKRARSLLWYYWLCLAELPYEIARPEIEKNREALLHQLNAKSRSWKSPEQRQIQHMLYCTAANCLSRLPEYSHLAGRQPYLCPEGKCYLFDTEHTPVFNTQLYIPWQTYLREGARYAGA